MSVSKLDRTIIRKLARTNVEQMLARMDTVLASSRWLQKSNRYAKNTIDRLKLDAGVAGSLHGKHLSQYISVSSILHCADGWSYLGRAISALLSGDPHRVVHLAYYAELRAALSLLAAEGIGVFRSVHFVVDAPRSARKLSRPEQTHQAAWAYLDYWSSLKRSGDLFAEIIAPAGVSLSSWFGSIGGVTNYVGPQARAWFRQWSMDLGLFSDDRDARNESSYRPDGIPLAWYVTGSDALTLATELWEACEPSQSSLFENIDRHILRITLEAAFNGLHGVSVVQSPDLYSNFVDSVVDPQTFDPRMASEWKRFFTRAAVPQDAKIFSYSSANPTDKVVGHAAVLSRATLLLRLAAGSALKLIRAAGISGNQLEFWWSALGLSRGVWEGSKDRGELIDLWDDISALRDDIREYQRTTNPLDQTFRNIASTLPHVVSGLGGYERVAIWSLAP
jgi:hypothetical protein